jgi:hypothetical protein
MSADNWTTCPRCFADARDAFEVERERVASLYGQVPVEEFDAARAALVEPKADDFVTFREDYEWYGASTGEVSGSYRGGCSKCGLNTEVETTRRFWPDAA